MRVDIDKLEALEKKHREAVEQWVPMFALDETEQDAIFSLLAEVRELRGIAEAARISNKHSVGECDCPWVEGRFSILKCDADLRDALARYDAGGTARALSGEGSNQ
jgi:hypothetical protein